MSEASRDASCQVRQRVHSGVTALSVLGLICAAMVAMVAGCASPPPRAMVIVPSAPVPASMPAPMPTPVAVSPAASIATAAANPAATTPGDAARAPGVSLVPLRLPEHWQRRQVLHLRQDAELVAWPNAVWAERVETGLTRRLSQALRLRSPEQGWWTGEEALGTRRLLVEVQQLDVHASRGEVVGTLNWRLVDRQGRVLDGGSLMRRVQATVGNAQQEAEALAQWVDAQAEALAPRLQGRAVP